MREALRNKYVQIALSVLAILAIGLADYHLDVLTRATVRLTLLYIFPIAILTWRAGLLWGLVASVLSLLVSELPEYFFMQRSISDYPLLWDTLMRLGGFAAMASSIYYLVRVFEEKGVAIVSLEKSNNDKALLLREMNHRVKNNLLVVESLLRLQSSEVNDAQTRKYFLESQQRVRAMSLIHEQLYKRERYNEMDISEYLRKLSRGVFEAYRTGHGRVRLVQDIDEALLDLDYMIPCGLIVNELVTNALKYGFPEMAEGEVAVKFKRLEEGSYLLSVSDTGIGLPEGFKLDQTGSLGMVLVRTLSEQVRGSLLIMRNEGRTEFRIVFSGTREN